MFTIKIKTDNAAFTESKALEIARILRELAEKIERSDSLDHVIMDYNGNNVGESKES